LEKKYANNHRVTILKGTSLEMLPKLQDVFDCILIDGDHNWYTVYHELQMISERNLLNVGGIVFFHDVEWPWGRRDMYYRSELVPSEYVHPAARKGVVLGQSELTDAGGSYPALLKAAYEGGVRNGVLTAIEDFLREHREVYRFFRVHDHYGLGIMYRRNSLADDFLFLSLVCKGTAFNIITWPRWFTKTHFPSTFRMARKLLTTRRINRTLGSHG